MDKPAHRWQDVPVFCEKSFLKSVQFIKESFHLLCVVWYNRHSVKKQSSIMNLGV